MVKTKIIAQAVINKVQAFLHPNTVKQMKNVWGDWAIGEFSSLNWLSYYDSYIICIGGVQYGIGLTGILRDLNKTNSKTNTSSWDTRHTESCGAYHPCHCRQLWRALMAINIYENSSLDFGHSYGRERGM